MQILQDWGFHKNWWRNQRGEFWVIGQMFLGIGFVLLPVVPVGEVPMSIRFWGAITAGIGALWLGVGGLWHLGENLTPLPHPKDTGRLITTGAYRVVRHPIYSSVILATLAWAIWQMSLSHAIASLVFLVFFDRKSAKEEVWLMDRFPEYQLYRQSVPKFIPFIY